MFSDELGWYRDFPSPLLLGAAFFAAIEAFNSKIFCVLHTKMEVNNP